MKENYDNSSEITIDVNAKLVTDINNHKDTAGIFTATIKPNPDIKCEFKFNNVTDSKILAAWTDLLNTYSHITEVQDLYNALKSNQQPMPDKSPENSTVSHQHEDELYIKNFKYNAMQDSNGNFTGKIIPKTNIECGFKINPYNESDILIAYTNLINININNITDNVKLDEKVKALREALESAKPLQSMGSRIQAGANQQRTIQPLASSPRRHPSPLAPRPQPSSPALAPRPHRRHRQPPPPPAASRRRHHQPPPPASRRRQHLRRRLHRPHRRRRPRRRRSRPQVAVHRRHGRCAKGTEFGGSDGG